jgi:hypothetical protein
VSQIPFTTKYCWGPFFATNYKERLRQRRLQGIDVTYRVFFTAGTRGPGKNDCFTRLAFMTGYVQWGSTCWMRHRLRATRRPDQCWDRYAFLVFVCRLGFRQITENDRQNSVSGHLQKFHSVQHCWRVRGVLFQIRRKNMVIKT